MNKPCAKRQAMSVGSVFAVAVPIVTAPKSRIALTMTRLRPTRSARKPTNGAASAQARVIAVIVRPTAASDAWNVERSSGSNGWVAYISMNALAPAVANAVYNAIGVRIRSGPITPDKILQALGKI